MSLLRRIEQGHTNSQTGEGEGGQRSPNQPARRVNPSGVGTQRDTFSDLKIRVQNRLLAELDPSMDVSSCSGDM